MTKLDELKIKYAEAVLMAKQAQANLQKTETALVTELNAQNGKKIVDKCEETQ
jgi:hypothetical protein